MSLWPIHRVRILGAEWVELYNPGTVDLDLTGWFWNTETTAFLPLETFPMV